ncbi:MAG: anti-sigma factor [bacterium]|nr:anti-sigma factor [bacterium]
MNHADVKKSLADYLEGDLSLEDRALVDAHLDGCEECAVEVAELEQTILILRSMPEPETPPMIAANVMRRIRAGETEPGFFERIRRGVTSVLEPSFMLPASAVAAAALVVVAIQDPGRFGLDDLRTPAAEGVGEPVVALEARTPIPMTVMSTARGTADSATAAARARTRDQVQLFRGAAPAERSGHLFAGAAPPPAFVLDATPRTVTRGTIDVRNQAVPVAAPIPPGMMPLRGDAGTDRAFDAVHTGATAVGEDPRDAWIALGLDRPADFARFLAGKTLAEQELWVERLADRAESRGLLDELVQALEAAPTEVAALLAADFVAEAGQLRAEAR